MQVTPVHEQTERVGLDPMQNQPDVNEVLLVKDLERSHIALTSAPVVGFDEGNWVGVAVGNIVGANVGLDVGTRVGDNVGTKVGITVGVTDGTKVGFLLGLEVG